MILQVPHGLEMLKWHLQHPEEPELPLGYEIDHVASSASRGVRTALKAFSTGSSTFELNETTEGEPKIPMATALGWLIEVWRGGMKRQSWGDFRISLSLFAITAARCAQRREDAAFKETLQKWKFVAAARGEAGAAAKVEALVAKAEAGEEVSKHLEDLLQQWLIKCVAQSVTSKMAFSSAKSGGSEEAWASAAGSLLWDLKEVCTTAGFLPPPSTDTDSDDITVLGASLYTALQAESEKPPEGNPAIEAISRRPVVQFFRNRWCHGLTWCLSVTQALVSFLLAAMASRLCEDEFQQAPMAPDIREPIADAADRAKAAVRARGLLWIYEVHSVGRPGLMPAETVAMLVEAALPDGAQELRNDMKQGVGLKMYTKAQFVDLMLNHWHHKHGDNEAVTGLNSGSAGCTMEQYDLTIAMFLKAMLLDSDWLASGRNGTVGGNGQQNVPEEDEESDESDESDATFRELMNEISDKVPEQAV